jgi:hypothetical protein
MRVEVFEQQLNSLKPFGFMNRGHYTTGSKHKESQQALNLKIHVIRYVDEEHP